MEECVKRLKKRKKYLGINKKEMKTNISKNKEIKKNLIPSWILSSFGIVKEVRDGVVIVKEGGKEVGMSEIVEFEKTGLNGNYWKLKSKKRDKINKRYYSKKNKFTQFKEGVKVLEIAVNLYEKEELSYYSWAAWLFLLMGYFSFYITANFAIFIPSSVIYLIGTIEFLCSLVLNIYITYKKIRFVISYPLDCNPKTKSKLVVASLLLTKPLFKYTAAVGGTVMGTNYLIQDLSGVNVIQEYGKNYIYGGKTFVETNSIILEKLKIGHKGIED